jgi:prolyl-tRNA editing enzyme YbaK/EbsC (Cys-tRNA(Pro) deacylase)
MDNKPPASLALESLGIKHRVFIHEQPVHSFEEAASARNQRPEQIVRSILFQVRDGEFVMVLMAGPGQIDWRKLRQIVKRSRVRMATEDEVLEVTGYKIGTVSPFGVKNQPSPEFDRRVKIMMDASVLKEDEISIGSGIGGVAIIMKSSDVKKALGDVEIVELGGNND